MDPGPAQRTLDVLWLEDDEEFAFVADRLFREGAREPMPDGTRIRPEVRRVSSLTEAIDDLATTGHPDLLVADLNLSDSRGEQTILRLREAAPGVPLLVLSGVAELEPRLLAAMENAEFMGKGNLTAERLWKRACMALTRAETA